MRPLRGLIWCCALAALAATGSPARAAWNNVFQVCCHNCRSSAAASPLAAVPAAPLPAAGCCPTPCAPQCTTRYVQRCYYQPVTTYRQYSYYEPVTTYRTSYYYEPVTSYRYSCYYDPCTCSYQQVAQPCTSYRLRSQCCPVTSYLQRCALQPVTSYRQAFYYEPVTTCCTTTTGAPVAAPPAALMPGAAAAVPGGTPPSVSDGSAPPVSAPPSVGDGRAGAPGVSDGLRYDRQPPQEPPVIPKVQDSGSSYRQPALRAPIPSPPPRVRLDRIAALPGHNLEGQVITAGRMPRAGATIHFVSADRRGERRAVATDRAGQFRVTLASGGWLVYVQDGAGTPVFQRRVEVRADQTHQLTLRTR